MPEGKFMSVLYDLCGRMGVMLLCVLCSLPFTAAAEEDWLGDLLDDLYSTPDSRSEGVRYFKEKKYPEALREFQKALDEEISLCGANTAVAAEIIADTAMVKAAMGDYQEALRDFRRALKIQEKVLADNDLQKVYTCNSVGLMYKNLGNSQGALKYYSKALKMCTDIVGETHSDRAAIFINIGDVYTDTEQYYDALENYRAAMEIYQLLSAKPSAHIAGCFNKIAVVYSLQENYAAAATYFAKAVDIYDRLEIENSDTVLFYLGYGQALLGAGDAAGAEQPLRRALKMSVGINGRNHEITVICRECLRMAAKRK